MPPGGSFLSVHSQKPTSRCRSFLSLFTIQTDGYTIDDLNFIWKEEKPLTIKEHLELPEFGIAGTKVGGCVKAFSTGIRLLLFLFHLNLCFY